MAKFTGWKNRVAGWFVDREFFMRSNGQVRFIKISAKLQRRVAGTIAGVVGVWLIVTLGMMINQVSVSAERMMLTAKQEKIETAEERVAKYRDDMEAVASDLEARQKVMESAFEEHFGDMPAADAAAPAQGEAAETAKKIGLAVPEAAQLAQLEARQIAFAERMTQIAVARSQKAEGAIRQFGLNPDQLAREAKQGMGGPFIPFFGKKQKQVRDPRFTRMLTALERMEAMEMALAGIPTSMPAAVGLMSSRFGYRSDPFTGSAAMHAGLDFKGPIGTPILAAADGKITSAGWQGGYGNCIEITHANGLVTRYAHMSGFTASLGQDVKRGDQIGRMGSTGRSTGSHLHFEVRINGSAINPLKFLEANPDVLEIQAVAGSRTGRSDAGA
ncbi:M23 family metallopeptidase [Sphingorhabdus sp.]|jgi:murein DD-endopeptidase MepM/ murein hydrolase activator NlpD|uniref:M23 family metallopeptidase n=1 Tax=Sphingorhabdus sp. TaxID=1902408 RepID=UPI0011D7712A|nr:M23 family metallopeptidase [Sphingorhabdus sp.]TXH12462.1 MAG: M23 family metallopeptidase [Gammaproteobacteria bacterium]HMT40258.1 M23 family metallopeptidase [Sphingorhabdus sp.]